MRLLSEIALGISKIADYMSEKGKNLFAAKLYRLATVMIRQDTKLMEELLKRSRETE